ncbi:MAG: putative phosphotransferase [Ilumatobacteraceae bacterium]|nr:putative phosphotransferase [Ilumatobacteraceae bacterium]
MSPDGGPAADLAHALSTALAGAVVDDLQRLSGGASRETWRFVADGRTLIVQRQRGGDGRDMGAEVGVLRAARAGGVPVPAIVATSDHDGGSFVVLEHIEGETIARKILRDDTFARARTSLTHDCAVALARLHAIDPATAPGLLGVDQVHQYRVALDDLGRAHPTFELVFRWLERHRPPARPPAVVHGDFRLGNLMVGPDGLRSVLDWELAHLGDPVEDLGWLCAKAWRFGSALPVAGVGEYAALLDAYSAASGTPVGLDELRWWEVLGTLKWGVMCIVQAEAHLSGASRSHELAAIGRRVCETEYDLLTMLDGAW